MSSRMQAMLAVCFVALAIAGTANANAGHARLLKQSGPTVNVQPGQSPFTLSVFSSPSSNECVVQGYPGSRADSVVPGPITFSVPDFIPAIHVNLQIASNSALILDRNDNTIVPDDNPTTGLTSLDYYKDSTSTSHGTLVAGLVPGYSPNSLSNIPVCYLTINFVTAKATPTSTPVSG